MGDGTIGELDSRKTILGKGPVSKYPLRDSAYPHRDSAYLSRDSAYPRRDSAYPSLRDICYREESSN